MKTRQEVNNELDEKIPRSAVSTRSGGGSKALSYLETHYVIDRLNKVFGNTSWDSEVVELIQLAGTDKPSYRCKVRIRAAVEVKEGQYIQVTKEGIGYGSDKSGLNPHEMAVKEAESDALKRAAMKFGMSLGLALYDKDQTNVEDDAPAGKPAAAAAAAPRAQATPSASTNSEPARQSNPAATRPAFNRDAANKRIATLSKIVISQQKATLDEIKADMQRDYGTAVKEDLSDDHAQALLSRLEKAATA